MYDETGEAGPGHRLAFRGKNPKTESASLCLVCSRRRLETPLSCLDLFGRHVVRQGRGGKDCMVLTMKTR